VSGFDLSIVVWILMLTAGVDFIGSGCLVHQSRCVDGAQALRLRKF
jgi:hypothetical protein